MAVQTPEASSLSLTSSTISRVSTKTNKLTGVYNKQDRFKTGFKTVEHNFLHHYNMKVKERKLRWMPKSPGLNIVIRYQCTYRGTQKPVKIHVDKHPRAGPYTQHV